MRNSIVLKVVLIICSVVFCVAFGVLGFYIHVEKGAVKVVFESGDYDPDKCAYTIEQVYGSQQGKIFFKVTLFARDWALLEEYENEEARAFPLIVTYNIKTQEYEWFVYDIEGW